MPSNFACMHASGAVAPQQIRLQPPCGASSAQPQPPAEAAEHDLQETCNEGSIVAHPGPSLPPKAHMAGARAHATAGRQVVPAEEGAASASCESASEHAASQEVTCPSVRVRKQGHAEGGTVWGRAQGCADGTPAASIGEVTPATDAPVLNGQGVHGNTDAAGGGGACVPETGVGKAVRLGEHVEGVHQGGGALPGHEREASP